MLLAPSLRRLSQHHKSYTEVGRLRKGIAQCILGMHLLGEGETDKDGKVRCDGHKGHMCIVFLQKMCQVCWRTVFVI